MIEFRNISSKPTTKWALTVNANLLKATAQTYSKYIGILTKKCENIKISYERGPKDRRLHFHAYLVLKNPMNKWAFRDYVYKKLPKGWKIDFSHKINNGWLIYMNKNTISPETQLQQDCVEASARGDDREHSRLKRILHQQEKDTVYALQDFEYAIQFLFPNANARDILSKKYFKIYSKLTKN